MVRFMPLLGVLVLLAVLPISAQDAPPKPKTEDVQVKGVTLDANGKPLAGMTVADMWTFDGTWKPKDGVKSDAEGKFALTVRTFPDQAAYRGYRIQAGDTDGKLSALAVVKADGLAAEFKLTLAPLCTVSATVVPPEGIEMKDGNYFTVYWKAPQTHICSARTKDRAATFSLPVGEYRYMLGAADCKYARGTFNVEAGRDKLELPPIKMEQTALSKMYGQQAAPISISYIRNLPADLDKKGAKVTLEDFKGRWVLMEFWGWW